MLDAQKLLELPPINELTDSDETPVDNEIQNLIPNLLLVILNLAWNYRNDWFLGVDMGVYHTTGEDPRVPIVPDAFLSLGVPRRKGQGGRRSYIIWDENNITPIWGLEVVSYKYNGEYDTKQEKYAKLGVLYYTIYNPDYWQRDRHEPLEVYKLINGEYKLHLPTSSDRVVWMPEVGLGIGKEQGIYDGFWEREWLYWYDEQGNRYSTPDDLLERVGKNVARERQQRQQAEQIADRERQQRQTLLRKLKLLSSDQLKALGIDPKELE